MQEIVKIGFMGIAGVLLAVQFRSQKPEFGIYIGLVVSILVFTYAIRQVEAVMGQLDRIRSYLGGAESYLGILLRVIGITYICEFSASICKDAGYLSLAGQIEILGKLAVMFAGLPVLFAVIEQIQSFI